MNKIIVGVEILVIVLLMGAIFNVVWFQIRPLISEVDASRVLTGVRNTFWVDNDVEKANEEYQLLAERLKAQNEQAQSVSDDALDGEMDAMLAYAESTSRLDLQKGLRIYADIYHNNRYEDNVRAQGLFHAMEFVNERSRNQISYDEAKLWAFAPGLFDEIFTEAVTTQNRVGTIFEIVEVALHGMKKAKELNTSARLGVQMDAAIIHLDVAFEATRVEERHEVEKLAGESLIDFEIRVGDKDELDKLYQKTIEIENTARELMSNTDRYTSFSPAFLDTMRNITRTYLRFQQHGYNVYPKMLSLQNFLKSYIEMKSDQFDESRQYSVDHELALNSLFVGCSYILGNEDGDLNEETVKEIIEPFVMLPQPHRMLMYGVSRVGKMQDTVCYEPYKRMGQLYPEFKSILINDVGGWTAEQFE